MTICPQCHSRFHKASLPISKGDTVYLACDRELSDPGAYQSLAGSVKALGLPRREVPNWMADVIYGFEGQLVWRSDTPFELGDEDIDLAFGDDGSMRWLSDFMRCADTPSKHRPQKRIISRLRLMDVAFRIQIVQSVNLPKAHPSDSSNSPSIHSNADELHTPETRES